MEHEHDHHQAAAEGTSYWPLFGILGSILLVTGVTWWFASPHSIAEFFRWFMGYFFLVFGAFKILQSKEFAHVFAEYDIVAKRWLPYGFLYPLIELALAALFLFNAFIGTASVIDLVIMTIGTIGVVSAMRGKRKYRCACLGAVVNLPLSTVSLIEDIGMGGLGLLMLFIHS